MKNRFQSEIDARLSDLTFTGQEQVLQRIRARQSVRPLPKRTVALVLALMLMLCGTAVALTLRYSAKFDLERHARGVLSSKYGLTGDMLDLFSAHTEQDENGWTVRFVPIGWDEQIGQYTVTGSADGGTQATWSHDGAGPSENVWGPEELQTFMDARKSQYSALAQAGGWVGTLEEFAAMDEPLLALAGADWQLNVLPGAEDFQPEAAEALARQTVMEKYGISEESLAECRVSLRFYLYTEDGHKAYRVFLDGGYELGSFDVVISSPEGEITRHDWWITAETARLPEGDLARYPDAAKEFVRGGGFDLLAPEEKAAVYRRYEEAGLSDLLPEGEFITPAPADLDEQAAIARAREAVMKTYDFPEAGFELFSVRTAMLRKDDGREWEVRFIGQIHDRYMWLDERTLGSYTVRLTSDGSVVGCEWSLASQYTGAHTQETFGQAEVFTGADLGYAVELIGKLDKIISKYPNYPSYVYDMDMSIEDRAAFDGLMRRAGFNPREYSNMLPRQTDVAEPEALQLARQVLRDEYGMTDEALDASTLETSFRMCYDLHDEPVRVWDFVFKGKDIYWVCINAEDGVIEEIDHDDLSLSYG